MEIKRHLAGSWWVVGVIALGSILYLSAMHKKEREQQEMVARLHALEQERLSSAQEQKDLLLQIQSYDDPDWVEMVLKQNLGLVREGQVKVYFKK